MEHFPFGETWVEEHSNRQRTPYLFTGKELDEDVQLYYFGARYYDPRTSVWQSPDPILASYLKGERGGEGVFTPENLSLYAYSHNRPVVMIDPDGNAAQACAIPPITGACVSAVAAAGKGLSWVVSALGLGYLANEALTNSGPAPGDLADMAQVSEAGAIANAVLQRTSFREMKLAFIDTAAGQEATRNNQKYILIPEAVIPDIAAADARGMADGHGNVLTWDPRGTLDGQNSAARRRAALSGQSYPVGSYVTLDNQLRPSSYEEYPFAATLQGGAGAHVEKVPLWQQFVQGGLIRGACAVQNCQAGDTVHVYIVPGNVYTPPPE
ncbi:hypothetical protein K3X13_15275 (plasmid) [Aliiroseovarius crassostreae]|uniref:RHS repeat-associated core domain-containing protein n=1 Tax=Aliiroseovarius crassostreae TaxID=154981 RepID=UPI00220B199B|nr:RHS repeat-associated core domain-containing protein [Aliiroseovarius crassostreae]UWP94038.1 hypothetical protein K3X13_15275 [Aliiroseovarius crassostreae]